MTAPDQFLYRGVHAKHPALPQAKLGVVSPGNIHGKVTPHEHNAGGVSARSPFTSWTRDRLIAMKYALSEGPGGVVLWLTVGPPALRDEWSWEWSPDEFYEDEVLLRGRRTGAKVELL